MRTHPRVEVSSPVDLVSELSLTLPATVTVSVIGAEPAVIAARPDAPADLAQLRVDGGHFIEPRRGAPLELELADGDLLYAWCWYSLGGTPAGRTFVVVTEIPPAAAE